LSSFDPCRFEWTILISSGLENTKFSKFAFTQLVNLQVAFFNGKKKKIRGSVSTKVSESSALQSSRCNWKSMTKGSRVHRLAQLPASA